MMMRVVKHFPIKDELKELMNFADSLEHKPSPLTSEDGQLVGFTVVLKNKDTDLTVRIIRKKTDQVIFDASPFREEKLDVPINLECLKNRLLEDNGERDDLLFWSRSKAGIYRTMAKVPIPTELEDLFSTYITIRIRMEDFLDNLEAFLKTIEEECGDELGDNEEAQ